MLSFPTNDIPNIVVVGIGYPIKGLEEWAANRHSHMTPTYDSIQSSNWKKMLKDMTGREDLVVHSGQVGKFLGFIKKELIPFVESKYRISKTDRAIFGYSLGGLFSLYCLFESPETFQRYFAGSPSIWWDKGVIFNLEENYAENHENLEANLFMSIGTLENRTTINYMWRMDSILCNRNFEDLKIHTMEFPDQIHQTCYPEAVTKALMTLYDGSDK